MHFPIYLPFYWLLWYFATIPMHTIARTKPFPSIAWDPGILSWEFSNNYVLVIIYGGVLVMEYLYDHHPNKPMKEASLAPFHVWGNCNAELTEPRQSWHSGQVLSNIKAQQFHPAVNRESWFTLTSCSNETSLILKDFLLSVISYWRLMRVLDFFACSCLMNTKENSVGKICQKSVLL